MASWKLWPDRALILVNSKSIWLHKLDHPQLFAQLLEASDKKAFIEARFSGEWAGHRTEYLHLWVSDHNTNVEGRWSEILPTLRREYLPVLPFLKALHRYGPDLPTDVLLTKDGVRVETPQKLQLQAA